MRSMIAFKIWEFIYFFIFTFIKGFTLKVCNVTEKYLYENKENLQMHVIVKLGCSPDYDALEAIFKSIV